MNSVWGELMSQTNEGGNASAVASATPVRIVPEIPAIYADTVLSQSYGPGISKFFLARFDSDPAATSVPSSVPVAQVIMPAEGFVQMVAFFQMRLQVMVDSQIISQDSVDKAHEYWASMRP